MGIGFLRMLRVDAQVHTAMNAVALVPAQDDTLGACEFDHFFATTPTDLVALIEPVESLITKLASYCR